MNRGAIIGALVLLFAASCGDRGVGGPREAEVIQQLDSCVLPHACVLEYNSALVEGDPCCLAVGGQNSCDTKVSCNALSGGNCCLIYATENTKHGRVCCLRADGSAPRSGSGQDITSECQALLDFSGGAASKAYCSGVDQVNATSSTAAASDCLLSYNTALVPAGADPCCYRVGGTNTCDLAKTCNALSGAGCCILYASKYTAGGSGCCLYPDGKQPSTAAGADRTQECAALLYLQR
jgi:hypothetical protein